MFNILKKVFSKTDKAITEIAPEKKKRITKEEFEDILLEADVNYELIEKFLETLPEKIERIQAFNTLISVFQYEVDWKKDITDKPFVEMIIGVNGAGKTTTIAKLANYHKKSGESIVLGAADTFRAAAIEQLSRWAKKLDVTIISTQQGHDPSAVVFDTIAPLPKQKMLTEYCLIRLEDSTPKPILEKSLKRWYVSPTNRWRVPLIEKCSYSMERKEALVLTKPRFLMNL